jgi:hypothetical protein
MMWPGVSPQLQGIPGVPQGPEGAADPVEYPLQGALDSVRISSARRDFSR